MNRTEQARELVAQAILNTEVGAQLPPTVALARRAGTGNGTVQIALKTLETEGAVAFTAHGGFGRVLRDRDLRALWAASGRVTLRGLLPLPQSRQFAGLATGFSALAEGAALPLDLLFRQGSQVRFAQLRSGSADFVVGSANAVRDAGLREDGWVLGDFTYYGRDSVVVITRAGRRPDPRGRVPVDRTSADHLALTEREFPDAQLVDTPYLFIPELIAAGTLDAAVWHQSTSSPLLTATGLAVHPLAKPPADGADDAGRHRAAIAWRAGDRGVGALLTETFRTPRLEEIQGDVVNGLRIPQF